MTDLPDGLDDTFLTERQSEVVVLRSEGLTQREIADRLGTSVANISAVEGAARDNVGRARRTLTYARLLHAGVRIELEPGDDLRSIADRIYEAGNAAGLKVAYPSAELSDHLRAHLGDRLEADELTDAVAVGITDDGDVVVHPSAVDPLAAGPGPPG